MINAGCKPPFLLWATKYMPFLGPVLPSALSAWVLLILWEPCSDVGTELIFGPSHCTLPPYSTHALKLNWEASWVPKQVCLLPFSAVKGTLSTFLWDPATNSGWSQKAKSPSQLSAPLKKVESSQSDLLPKERSISSLTQQCQLVMSAIDTLAKMWVATIGTLLSISTFQRCGSNTTSNTTVLTSFESLAKVRWWA